MLFCDDSRFKDVSRVKQLDLRAGNNVAVVLVNDKPRSCLADNHRRIIGLFYKREDWSCHIHV